MVSVIKVTFGLFIMSIIFQSGSAFALQIGFADLGIKTIDGKYVLPHCGTYSLSFKSRVDVCLIGTNDAFSLPDGARLTYSVTSDAFGESISFFPYAYSENTMIFAANLPVYDGGNPTVTKIQITSLTLSSVPQAATPLVAVDAISCGKVLLAQKTVYAVCGDQNDVILYKYSLTTRNLEKFPLFSAADAGVKSGYQVVPTLVFDAERMALVSSMPKEDLGGGFRNFPQGSIDLSSGRFIGQRR